MKLKHHVIRRQKFMKKIGQTTSVYLRLYYTRGRIKTNLKYGLGVPPDLYVGRSFEKYLGHLVQHFDTPF